jgi:hypothetical protein
MPKNTLKNCGNPSRAIDMITEPIGTTGRLHKEGAYPWPKYISQLKLKIAARK